MLSAGRCHLRCRFTQGGSGALLALLHETGFRCTRKRLPITAYCLCCAGIGRAFLHERRLRRAGERLAVLADSLGFASLLRERGTAGKCQNERRYDQFPEHGISSLAAGHRSAQPKDIHRCTVRAIHNLRHEVTSPVAKCSRLD